MICKRAEDLLDIIKLNKFGFSNCDIPPINYDIFIRSFGVRYAKQIDCQTVVLKHIDVQTDCVTLNNKWTQTPPVINIEFGSDVNDVDVIKQNRHKSQIQNIDPFILNNFLLKIEFLMTIIVKSEYNGEDNKIITPSGAEKFSESFTTIKCLEICKKSAINYMFYSRFHLFCVQNVSLADSAEKSLIAVWNLLILDSEPEKLLICRSHITCAISDDNSTLVIAALIDGSVVLWDTQEQSHYHKKLIVDQNKAFILRTPSYNSAITGKGHKCEVISIDKISSEHHNSLNDLFQFATIDRNGLLIMWTITQSKDESNDCGISPVSKWTLIRNSIVDIMAGFSELSTNTKITSFQCPYDWSHFYSGTDSGVVIRCARYHLNNSLSKIYLRSGVLNSNDVIVTSIMFNKLSANSFLVGYSDGIICYFSTDLENSLLIFDTNNYRINGIQWFENRSATFIALNDNNEIFIFDLNSNSLKCLTYYKHVNSDIRLLSFKLCKGFDTHLIFGTNSGNCFVFDLIDKLSFG